MISLGLLYFSKRMWNENMLLENMVLKMSDS